MHDRHHHHHRQQQQVRYLFLSSLSSSSSSSSSRRRRRTAWKTLLLVATTVVVVWKEQVASGRMKRNENIIVATSADADAVAGASTGTATTKRRMKKYRLPNVQLIGVQKGGTSAIAVWLFHNGHFRHAFARQDEPFFYDKEPHFFDLKHRYEQGIEFYASRFIDDTTPVATTDTTNTTGTTRTKGLTERYVPPQVHHTTTTTTTAANEGTTYVMDATPDTFQVPERVKATYLEADDDGDDEGGGGGHHHHHHRQLDNLKIMVILREPISRELSLYNHLRCQYLQYMKDDPSKITDWHRKIEKHETTTRRTGTKTNSTQDKNDNDNDNASDDGTSSMIMSFDEYVDRYTIPALLNGQLDRPDRRWEGSSRHGLYAHYLSKWFASFERRQILVMSYDEFVNDPDTLQSRIKQFLQLDEEKGDITPGGFMSDVNSFPPFCKIRLSNVASETIDKLKSEFEPLNEQLYTLLESNPGPSMEQRPFPKFKLNLV